ncbi:MAG: flagellar basal body rod protein FlgB [Myxococcales bacterium]
MKVFDRTLETLERSLDVRLERQNVLAGNVANADTPDFVPQDVDFKKAMAEPALAGPEAPAALASSGSAPMLAIDGPRGGVAGGSARVVAEGAAAGLDGNAVDLDRAMVALAQNALQYQASAKAAGKKLAILRYVASDGAA